MFNMLLRYLVPTKTNQQTTKVLEQHKVLLKRLLNKPNKLSWTDLEANPVEDPPVVAVVDRVAQETSLS